MRNHQSRRSFLASDRGRGLASLWHFRQVRPKGSSARTIGSWQV